MIHHLFLDKKINKIKDGQKNWDDLNEMQRATQFLLPNIALSYILSIKL